MRTAKEKGILALLLAFFTLIGMFAGVDLTRNKAYAAEDYRLWRQMDKRWSSEPIGGSTVGKSGCYITSIAMAAAASGARSTDNFDPGVFAKALNRINAFTGGGALASWSSIPAVVPDISIFMGDTYFKSDNQSGKAKEIKEHLDKGFYVICNVGGHWVYVDGIIGDDVYMADPAKDDILMFKAYQNSNIRYYQTIKAKNPYSGFTPLNAAKSTTTVSVTAAPAVTTSTTAVTTVKAVPSVTYKTGEYYCTDSTSVKVWDDITEKKEVIASLGYGNVVNVVSVSGEVGEVRIDGKMGYVELSKLQFADNPEKFTVGDVNNDGEFSAYDLALMNEYLNSLEKLPEGISVLTSSEIAAADLSGDGIVDSSDVLLYLMLICN